MAAIAVTFLLGLPHLGTEPLWVDEILSWSVYRHSANPVEMTRYLAANENHPPLYYLVMDGWVSTFGDTPRALRSFSLLCALAAVGMLYGLAREWFGRKTAALAALTMALSPVAVEFSREARPYMLLAAVAVGAWWALSRFLATGTVRGLAVFAVLGVAGLYTHYAYWFILGSQALAAFAFTPRAVGLSPRRRMLLAAFAGVGVVYLPWLPVLAKNLFAQYRTVGGLQPLAQIVPPVNFLPLDVVVNFLFFPAKWPVDAFGRLIQGATLVALALGLGAVVAAAWRQWRQPGSDFAAARHWQRLMLVGLWIAVPPLLLLVSPIAGRYSWYYQRHLLPTLPGVAMAVALAAQELLRRLQPVFSPTTVGATAVAAYLLVNSPQYLTNDERWDPQHQFPAVARAIEAREGGGRELTIGLWPNYRLVLDYYYRGRHTVGSLVPEALGSRQLAIVSGDRRLTPVEGYLLTHPNLPYLSYQLPVTLPQYDRLWVVSVTPSLFDLDVALAAAGWQPTFVALPEPLRMYLFRFDHFGGVCRPSLKP